MVQVQCIRKENIVTGKDYGNAFVSIINNLLTDCDEERLIFDRYLDGSFKEVTRQKRSQHVNPVRYRISDEMDFRRISMKSLLSHSSNKDNITHFLKDKILKSFETSPKRMITVFGTKTESNNIHNFNIDDHNHEEADSLIPFHCLHAASYNPGCKIKVYSVDTDVYILLLSIAYEIQTDHFYMVAGKGKRKREIDIHERALAVGRKKCEPLLGLHAFAGADWGGKLATISKKTWIKAFLPLEEDDEIVAVLTILGNDHYRPTLETCIILEKFTCMVYSPKSSKRTLRDLRWELFRLKSKEGEKLPPTWASFLPHVWRGNYITMVWKSCRLLMMDLPPPNMHGWVRNEKNMEPIMCLKPPAPGAMLILVKCSCKTSCNNETRRCGCSKNNFPCTDACGCSDCENKPTEKLSDIIGLECDLEDDMD